MVRLVNTDGGHRQPRVSLSETLQSLVPRSPLGLPRDCAPIVAEMQRSLIHIVCRVTVDYTLVSAVSQIRRNGLPYFFVNHFRTKGLPAEVKHYNVTPRCVYELGES